MLSKILKITTPILLIFIILFIGYNSYKQVTENTENPLNIIPTNAAVILQCNDADALYNTLNATDIWGHLRNISTVDSINSQIKEISSFYNQYPLTFKNHTLFISFHKVGANNSGLLFSSNFDRKVALENSQVHNLLGNLITEGQYNNQPIFELLHKGSTLFLSFKGDIVFFSENKMLVFGPYAADGFFGSNQHTKFDAILAMYHDQGLAPFKALTFESGVNYTAGLKYIRTSPDHGTGYSIAGKNEASPNSFRNAVFEAINLFSNRNEYAGLTKNVLKPQVAERQKFYKARG